MPPTQQPAGGMTLEQLQAMGAKPVSATPTAPKQGLTLAQLQAMGAKPVAAPAPQRASAPQAPAQPVDLTPSPMTPIAPTPPAEDSGGVGGFLKSLVSAPATMIARPLQAVAELAGASADDVDAFTKKVTGGIVAPVPRNAADVKKDVGRGIETAAFGLGPVAGGAAFGAGNSLEQGNDLFSAQTAIQTALGAGAGKALDWVGKPLLNAAGKVVGKITPQIVKDVAAKGAGAISEFAATHQLLPDALSKPINKAVNPIPSATAAEQKFQQAQENVAQAYRNTLPLTPTEKIKQAKLLEATGSDNASIYAKYGINVGSPDALPQLEQVSDLFKNATQEAQQHETTNFSLDKIRADAESYINSSIPSQTGREAALSKVNGEIDATLKANPDKIMQGADGATLIKPELAEQLRQAGNSFTPFNASDPEKVGQSAGYALANAVRDRVEADGTFPAYREANREWSKVLSAKDSLTNIEGSGKPFKTLGGLSGAIARRTLSGVLGYHSFGIGGAVLAELGSEAAAKLISNPEWRTYFDRKLINNVQGKNPTPAVVAKLTAEIKNYLASEEAARATRLALPAPKEGTVYGKTQPLYAPYSSEPRVPKPDYSSSEQAAPMTNPITTQNSNIIPPIVPPKDVPVNGASGTTRKLPISPQGKIGAKTSVAGALAIPAGIAAVASAKAIDEKLGTTTYRKPADEPTKPITTVPIKPKGAQLNFSTSTPTIKANGKEIPINKVKLNLPAAKPVTKLVITHGTTTKVIDDPKKLAVATRVKQITDAIAPKYTSFMLRLADAEGGFVANARNHNVQKDGTRSTDRGLFQINNVYQKQVSDKEADNLDYSVLWTLAAIQAGHQAWWSSNDKVKATKIALSTAS